MSILVCSSSAYCLPLLKGEKVPDWRQSLYYHFYEYPAEHMVMRHFGIRTERYKLIHFYNSGDFYELYDLQNDPYEKNNLISDPSLAQTRKELREILLEYMKKAGEPVLNITESTR